MFEKIIIFSLFIYLSWNGSSFVRSLDCGFDDNLNSDDLVKAFLMCNSSLYNTADGWSRKNNDSRNGSEYSDEEDTYVRNYTSRGNYGNNYNGNREFTPYAYQGSTYHDTYRNYQNYGSHNDQRVANQGYDNHGYDRYDKVLGYNYQEANRYNDRPDHSYQANTGYNRDSDSNRRLNNRSTNSDRRSSGNGHERKNYSNNWTSSKKDDEKCEQINCLFNNLHLIGRNKQPDRNMIMQKLAQNASYEFKDFLDDALEDCLAIINANGSNKSQCEQSLQLMDCINEKASNNCEDWEEGAIFPF